MAAKAVPRQEQVLHSRRGRAGLRDLRARPGHHGAAVLDRPDGLGALRRPRRPGAVTSRSSDFDDIPAAGPRGPDDRPPPAAREGPDRRPAARRWRRRAAAARSSCRSSSSSRLGTPAPAPGPDGQRAATGRTRSLVDVLGAERAEGVEDLVVHLRHVSEWPHAVAATSPCRCRSCSRTAACGSPRCSASSASSCSTVAARRALLVLHVDPAVLERVHELAQLGRVPGLVHPSSYQSGVWLPDVGGWPWIGALERLVLVVEPSISGFATLQPPPRRPA